MLYKLKFILLPTNLLAGILSSLLETLEQTKTLFYASLPSTTNEDLVSYQVNIEDATNAKLYYFYGFVLSLIFYFIPEKYKKINIGILAIIILIMIQGITAI